MAASEEEEEEEYQRPGRVYPRLKFTSSQDRQIPFKVRGHPKSLHFVHCSVVTTDHCPPTVTKALGMKLSISKISEKKNKLGDPRD